MMLRCSIQHVSQQPMEEANDWSSNFLPSFLCSFLSFNPEPLFVFFFFIKKATWESEVQPHASRFTETKVKKINKIFQQQ